MPPKKVNIGTKPANKSPNAEEWVSNRAIEPPLAEVPQEEMKRLTLDIPKSLHRAIKKKAADEGVAMADMLRDLLLKHFCE